MPPSPSTRQLPRAGFSLIELLVIAVLIGILSAIVVPVVGQARKHAWKSQSASNLRQTGLAVLAYAGDNGGTLPGPLWVGMHTYAKGSDPKLLGTLLAPYLNVTLPEDPQEIVQMPLLTCPMWLSLTTDKRGKAWGMATHAELLDGSKVPPFGNASRSPVTLADLRSPGQAPAMVHREGIDAGVLRPVFDTVRLQLYLDAHVQEIPVQ